MFILKNFYIFAYFVCYTLVYGEMPQMLVHFFTFSTRIFCALKCISMMLHWNSERHCRADKYLTRSITQNIVHILSVFSTKFDAYS